MNTTLNSTNENQQSTSVFQKSYADFGLFRSYRQLRKAMTDRGDVVGGMSSLLDFVTEADERMAEVYGGPINDLDILEIGPGQGMERALYFGRTNRVTTLDTDIIPFGFEPKNYVRMARTNGIGRVVKTTGREVVIGRKNRQAWKKLIAAKKIERPKRLNGDICQDVPAPESFDVVMSWSVFEHVADPAGALDNVLASLRPGGIFYISLHLWTCNNGHHDIRSFTGGEFELPMWAHLREQTKRFPKPSAYLNEWRLAQWRELFESRVPNHTEVLEQFEHPEVYGPLITGGLAEQLSDYSNDELLTVNAVYIGKKE